VLPILMSFSQDRERAGRGGEERERGIDGKT
jgi:hypothetical protein